MPFRLQARTAAYAVDEARRAQRLADAYGGGNLVRPSCMPALFLLFNALLFLLQLALVAYRFRPSALRAPSILKGIPNIVTLPS